MCPSTKIAQPNLEGLRAGLPNLDKHLRNLRSFGQNVVIVFNRFAADTDEEMALLRQHCEEVLEAPFVINNAYAEGGAGAEEMAQIVVDAVEKTPSAPCALPTKTATTCARRSKRWRATSTVRPR